MAETCNITALTKGEKGDSGLSGNGYLTAKVTLTTAQVLALFTTPIQLVAAPGVNFALQVINVMVRLNYNTIPYNTNTSLGIYNTGGTNYQHLISGVLGDNFTKIGIGSDQMTTTGISQVIENTSLVVSSIGGNPLAGNSSVDIYLTYTIVAL